jgi:hypothetical protein
MNQSLRVLLARVLDYAGMFPPAELSLEETVRSYAALRAGGESWMLARLVCPVGRLADLESLAPEHLGGGPPCPVAAIGRGAEGGEELLDALGGDLREIGRFNAGRTGTVVDQLEVRLPAAVVDAGDDGVAHVVARAGALAEKLAGARLLLAFEVALAGAPRDVVEAAIKGVARAGAGRSPHARWLPCVKIRCGGAGASAVPAVAAVAHAVVACRDRRLLLKATQGLHHPFRRGDSTLGVPVHGFLNLIVACQLAWAHGFDEAGVAEVLEDVDATGFLFDSEGLRWRGTRATMNQIAEGRRFGFASFGSCSFAEPRDELRELGLLPDLAGEGPGAVQ